MEKYFVTRPSVVQAIGTWEWRTQILDDYVVPDGYFEKARQELSKDIKFVTFQELYKELKEAGIKRGSGNAGDVEIILSLAAKHLQEEIQSDFPEAQIWVYKA